MCLHLRAELVNFRSVQSQSEETDLMRVVVTLPADEARELDLQKSISPWLLKVGNASTLTMLILT